VLDLKLDGVWVQANAGDLVRMPRGIPHGYFNKSDRPARALFWVSPMQKLEALFDLNEYHPEIPETTERLNNLTRALLTAHGENALDVFQDDGAVVEQFRVTGVDQMMSFDCGGFELK